MPSVTLVNTVFEPMITDYQNNRRIAHKQRGILEALSSDSRVKYFTSIAYYTYKIPLCLLMRFRKMLSIGFLVILAQGLL